MRLVDLSSLSSLCRFRRVVLPKTRLKSICLPHHITKQICVRMSFFSFFIFLSRSCVTLKEIDETRFFFSVAVVDQMTKYFLRNVWFLKTFFFQLLFVFVSSSSNRVIKISGLIRLFACFVFPGHAFDEIHFDFDFIFIDFFLNIKQKCKCKTSNEFSEVVCAQFSLKFFFHLLHAK